MSGRHPPDFAPGRRPYRAPSLLATVPDAAPLQLITGEQPKFLDDSKTVVCRSPFALLDCESYPTEEKTVILKPASRLGPPPGWSDIVVERERDPSLVCDPTDADAPALVTQPYASLWVHTEHSIPAQTEARGPLQVLGHRGIALALIMLLGGIAAGLYGFLSADDGPAPAVETAAAGDELPTP